ncbi:MAG: hypothetical protein U0892_10910 [Pirellulales bacterium]
MDSPKAQISNTKLIEVLQVYWAWRRLWIVTTILFACVGVTFCLTLKTDHWIASQGLIVRDEANGAVMRLGRFQSQTEMKAAQETILEMARNVQVVGDALRKVGPEQTWLGKHSTEDWPTQRSSPSLLTNRSACMLLKGPSSERPKSSIWTSKKNPKNAPSHSTTRYANRSTIGYEKSERRAPTA